MEYSYDPLTGELKAEVLDSSEPVVTGWDDTPPSRDVRVVGSWEVEPNPDGVTVTRNAQPPEIPERLAEQLRAQAEREGRPVRSAHTVRHDHDLDTRETQASIRRARSRTELSPDYSKVLERLQAANQPRQAPNRRRGRAKDNGEKKGGYKMPEIIITLDNGDRRRTRL